VWDKRSDMVVHEADPYNAEPPPEAIADRPLTPTDAFYSRNHGPVPDIDGRTWTLRVDGLVGSALDLSLDDLQRRFEPTTVVATLQCAGNRRTGLLAVRDIPGESPWSGGATSTASWTGARLADVLRAAGAEPDETAHVAFEAPDVSQDAHPAQPYGSSIPLAKGLSGEVLLAWQMNDAPLLPVHGSPVRVVVPGYIGARSVKWVQRVTVQPEPSASYFQAVAYRLLPPDADPASEPGRGFALGPVALNSDILRPCDGDTVPAGSTEVSGYAYAGEGRSVTRVDVSCDDGLTWTQADLGEPDGPWAWRLWRSVLDLPEGRHRVTVRAWDTTGASQPESAAALWNPKGYVNNSWARIELRADAARPACL
jgi:sulfite oxidase